MSFPFFSSYKTVNIYIYISIYNINIIDNPSLLSLYRVINFYIVRAWYDIDFDCCVDGSRDCAAEAEGQLERERKTLPPPAHSHSYVRNLYRVKHL